MVEYFKSGDILLCFKDDYLIEYILLGSNEFIVYKKTKGYQKIDFKLTPISEKLYLKRRVLANGK